jgi:hypothetical protein
VDQKEYRSMIGSLLYLTATRPGIQFSVLWQPTQENTVLSPKTDPLWSLSNTKVSSCR